MPFLRALRDVGVRDLKVDTVGTGLAPASRSRGRHAPDLAELLGAVDYLGIPLDGWSNASTAWFRAGRRRLFDETRALLSELDRREPRPRVVVNSVAHRRNAHGFQRILGEVREHPCVVQWNVFQYTPTDQVLESVNHDLRLDDPAFARVGECLQAAVNSRPATCALALRTVHSRLGQYLLINSDGSAWLPDEWGRTIPLGTLADGEEALLATWSDEVGRLRARLARSALRSCRGEPAHPLERKAGDLPQLLA